MSLKNYQYNAIMRMYDERQSASRTLLAERQKEIDHNLPAYTALHKQIIENSMNYARTSLFSSDDTGAEEYSYGNYCGFTLAGVHYAFNNSAEKTGLLNIAEESTGDEQGENGICGEIVNNGHGVAAGYPAGEDKRKEKTDKTDAHFYLVTQDNHERKHNDEQNYSYYWRHNNSPLHSFLFCFCSHEICINGIMKSFCA